MYMHEFMESSRRILLAIAMWPKPNSSLVDKIRTAFTLGNIFLLTMCLFYNSTFHSRDLIQLSKSLYILISVVNCFMKSIMLARNKDEFLRLLNMLDIASFTNFQTTYRSLMSVFMSTFKLVEKCYLFQVLGALIFTTIFPVLESKPLPMDFPHFNNGTFHYPFYIFETVSLGIAAYSNASLDLLTVGVIAIAAIQLKILNLKLIDTEKNVKSLDNYSELDVEQLTKKYLNECCNHYCDIEEYVKCLLDVFSVNIFIQLGTSVVAICNSGMMILAVDLVSLKAVGIYFYTTAMLAQLAMYCWFGNIVLIESLEITTSCYMSQWYKRKRVVGKALFLLMERSKRPLEIRGLKFVTLSFGTFIIIMKWAYSYFTLLRNYTIKHN